MSSEEVRVFEDIVTNNLIREVQQMGDSGISINPRKSYASVTPIKDSGETDAVKEMIRNEMFLGIKSTTKMFSDVLDRLGQHLVEVLEEEYTEDVPLAKHCCIGWAEL